MLSHNTLTNRIHYNLSDLRNLSMLPLGPIFAKTKVFINNVQEIISKTQLTLSHSLTPPLSVVKEIYIFLNTIVSKICDFMAFTIRTAAEVTLLAATKADILYQYTHRRVYVWKTLSARHKWYKSKKENLYNPKLNATIFPTWVCTWNLSYLDEHYHGLESLESAQDIAFKMWMKKRLLEKRLKSHTLENRIPINLTEKILSTPKIFPNKIHLREAVFNDIADLIILMEKNGYPKPESGLQSQIRTYLDDPRHHILIAIRGKKIVGFIAFVIYDLFVSEGKRCRIEGLVVDAKQPDLGVKRRLMQAAEASAKKHNGKVIDLIDGFCRTKDGSHDFYKFLGYNSDGSIAKVYLRKEL